MTQCKSTQMIREDVKKYYQNKKEIEGQKKRLEMLDKRIAGIQEDMKNPFLNHSLKTYVRGTVYETAVVSGGALPSSVMEREIEAIYKNLETELQNAQSSVLKAKADIWELERQNSNMDFYMSILSEEFVKLFDMRFLEKKSIVKISMDLNMSEATVSRNFREAYNAIDEIKSRYEQS
ncbi:MAG: hypothetical protein HFE62_05060 [Firmicutes bacterium]|nr:hypothetical protein [Bacillota bacterium]